MISLQHDASHPSNVDRMTCICTFCFPEELQDLCMIGHAPDLSRLRTLAEGISYSHLFYVVL